jgi:hypothetical protein
MSQDIDFYERLFSELFDLVADLREKILLKEGVFLKKHRYSKEQLFHDPILFKLGSRFGVIDYNVRSWKESGSVDARLLSYCEQNLSKVERALEHLIREIEQRKPTGWERITSFLRGIVKLALGRLASDVLPRIGRFRDDD